MPIVPQVILALLWFLVGCIISVPYTYFTGGNFENFFMMAWIAPVMAFFLFLVYAMRGIGWHGGKRPKWGGGGFWILVAYFCLPILLNGASLLLKWAGYEMVGYYAFKGRFVSLLVVPMILVLCGMVADGVKSLRQRFSGNATPPSSTPPSNGDPNRTAVILPSEERKINPDTFQLASI